MSHENYVTDDMMMSDAAEALLDDIDLLLDEGRRAFSLALDASLGAQIDVEAMNANDLALVVYGKGGLPTARAVSQIREAVKERGLRVAALSIA